MKLDSKQMHIVSQLFMAAGKAGHPFDLARFIKEPGYSSETMAKLSLHAGAKGDDALQSLAAQTMDMLSSINIPEPAREPATQPSTASAPTPTPSAPAQAESAAGDASQKYVGRLR
jgi:hypothetical protein